MAEVYLHSRCARICPCSVACCVLYVWLLVTAAPANDVTEPEPAAPPMVYSQLPPGLTWAIFKRFFSGYRRHYTRAQWGLYLAHPPTRPEDEEEVFPIPIVHCTVRSLRSVTWPCGI